MRVPIGNYLYFDLRKHISQPDFPLFDLAKDQRQPNGNYLYFDLRKQISQPDFPLFDLAKDQ